MFLSHFGKPYEPRGLRAGQPSGRGNDSSSRSRTRGQQVLGDFERCDRLFPRDGGKVVDEALQVVAGGEIVQQVLDRDARAAKTGVPPSTSGSQRTTDSSVGMLAPGSGVPCYTARGHENEVAERVGFEPTCRFPDKTLSRRPRYDHFGTSPHMLSAGVRWSRLPCPAVRRLALRAGGLGRARLRSSPAPEERLHQLAALGFEHAAYRAHAVVERGVVQRLRHRLHRA